MLNIDYLEKKFKDIKNYEIKVNQDYLSGGILKEDQEILIIGLNELEEVFYEDLDDLKDEDIIKFNLKDCYFKNFKHCNNKKIYDNKLHDFFINEEININAENITIFLVFEIKDKNGQVFDFEIKKDTNFNY